MIKNIVILVINFFDFFYKNKIINFLKKKKINIEYFIDVGAHHGETIELFSRNFKIKKIYAFEPSPINFKNLKKKYQNKKIFFDLKLENFALGNSNKNIEFYQLNESSSSTAKKLNFESNYLLRKLKLLNLNQKNYLQSFNVKQIKLSKYYTDKNINKVDFLKIDTEGSEFEILRGLDEKIKGVNYIFFEHHYDDMIKKDYKFSDINQLLRKNNFKLIFKSKMPFRRTFEYIFKNLSID